MELLEELRRATYFSLAVYGWHLDALRHSQSCGYLTASCWACRLCLPVWCGGCCNESLAVNGDRLAGQARGDNCCGCHNAAMTRALLDMDDPAAAAKSAGRRGKHFTGDRLFGQGAYKRQAMSSFYTHAERPSRVVTVLSSWVDGCVASESGELPYAVFLDPERRAVVVAVRGTLSLSDMATDLWCDEVPLQTTKTQRQTSGKMSMESGACSNDSEKHDDDDDSNNGMRGDGGGTGFGVEETKSPGNQNAENEQGFFGRLRDRLSPWRNQPGSDRIDGEDSNQSEVGEDAPEARDEVCQKGVYASAKKIFEELIDSQVLHDLLDRGQEPMMEGFTMDCGTIRGVSSDSRDRSREDHADPEHGGYGNSGSGKESPDASSPGSHRSGTQKKAKWGSPTARSSSSNCSERNSGLRDEDGELTVDWGAATNYRLIFVGHSLGGGVAALLARLSREDSRTCHWKARTVARLVEPIGWPLSRGAADETDAYTVSCTFGEDLWPRMSRRAAEVSLSTAVD